MEEKLLEILEKICDDEAVREDLEMDLMEEGLMDSIAVVELIVAIEEEFGVALSPTEYEKEDWSTVRKIEKILKEKGVQ
jgi:D-alanine--poly(phosphoribitol) ligase subunit 2